MWLITMAITIGALGVLALAVGRWRVQRRPDHGSMSTQWRAGHRTDDRYI
jgi:hypothetical protein